MFISFFKRKFNMYQISKGGGISFSIFFWREFILLVDSYWSRARIKNPYVKRFLFKLKLVVFIKINKTNTELFENWYRTCTLFMENRTFVSRFERLRTNYFLQLLMPPYVLSIIHNVSKDRSGNRVIRLSLD